MTKRRPMTPARRDRILIRAYQRAGMFAPCAICGKPIVGKFTAEHMTPFALGGADDDGEDNVRPVHDACAAAKTHGTAATGHRGDISAIRRAERLANGGKNRAPGPKGRSALQSRGFDKTMKRKVNGRVERREEV